ncbi:MAG: septal ring lytic transglycosylase RlpA family protein [Microvirga sp.]
MTRASRALIAAALIGFAAMGGEALGADFCRGVERGKASWYGAAHHGRRTANGETFDRKALTAAHRSLPFGTRLRVTNERTGRSVVVRVNDRGPFGGGRVIDISQSAALVIGLSGVGKVVLTRL